MVESSGLKAPAEPGAAPSSSDPIHTPDRRVRVFVSSTLAELADERRAARAAIVRLRLTPVMFELGARPHPPRDLYRAYLAQSDVFVAIYWERYGWVAPGETVSGLEDEYLLAGERPKLIYVKTPAQGREPRLAELLSRVQSDDRASYRRFADATELEDLLADDLAVLLTERFSARAGGPADLGPSRLPVPPTGILGRDAEVAALRRLARRPDVRLITVVGAGGIGKTRLALEVAAGLPVDDLDGVWFVDLSPVTDPDLVPARLADAFGVRSESQRPILDVLADRLGSRRALFVIDNFEQVLPAAPALARLLAACPGLCLLVTSRTALRLRGEHEFPLPPLRTPTADLAVADSPAVQLFLARARDVRPDFALSADNVWAVGEVCRRLDGVPLAIELAAAQVRVLSPAVLLRRLSARLDLPAPQVDVPERQRTLRATIDWSHSLLGPAEQALLARLSVFDGGWTLDGAEAVGAVDGDLDVVDTLSALVAHSLVTADEQRTDDPRFRMLDTVREYARERLDKRDERTPAMRRLAGYLLQLSARAGSGMIGQENRAWIERINAELDNVRAALRWAVEVDDAETVIRIAAPVYPFWWSRGLLREMLALAEQTAALPSAERLPPDAAALLLWCRGVLRSTVGSLAEAGPFLRRLVPAARELGDERLLALSLASLGLAQVEDQPVGAAREPLEEAVATFRRLDDAWGLSFALLPLGLTVLRTGDLVRAAALHRESLQQAERIDNNHLRAQALTQLGLDALMAGDVPAARSWYAAAAAVHRRLLDQEGLANCLDGLSGVAVGLGRPAVAARLHGAAARIRQVVGVAVWPLLRPLAEQLVMALRAALGEEAYRAEREVGAAMRPADAVSYALDATAPEPAAAPVVSAAPDPPVGPEPPAGPVSGASPTPG